MDLKPLGRFAFATTVLAMTAGCAGDSSTQSTLALREAVANAPISPSAPNIVRCATPAPKPADLIEEIQTRGPVKFPRTGVEVPVYIHVVTAADGSGSVSTEALDAQMAVLNNSYSTATGSVESNIKFKLMGATVTANDAWHTAGPFSSAENAMKSTLRVGGAGTLNLYITGIGGGTLGYATYPSEFGTSPNLDGVVVRFDTLPGGAMAPYNLGDTATHEVGHWLGLLHTFEGGCSNTNDGVRDTPAEAFGAIGCPIGRDTCTGKYKGLDPVTNFMNYSDDDCMFLFTAGQVSRMQSQWATYRNSN